MSWDDLERPDIPETDEQQQALGRQTVQALDNSPMLVRYLRTTLQSPSFARGRAPEDVAFAEGQRFMALQILKLGGKFDE